MKYNTLFREIKNSQPYKPSSIEMNMINKTFSFENKDFVIKYYKEVSPVKSNFILFRLNNNGEPVYYSSLYKNNNIKTGDIVYRFNEYKGVYDPKVLLFDGINIIVLPEKDYISIFEWENDWNIPRIRVKKKKELAALSFFGSGLETQI